MHRKRFLVSPLLLGLSIAYVAGCDSTGGEPEVMSGAGQESMYSIFVAINVKPEHVDAFRQASVVEAQGTVDGEPGVFQFHMLTDEENPNRFYFFEIFRNEAAAEAHWETENFKGWWETIEGMMDGEPERLGTMRTVFPSTQGLERQKAGLSH